MAQTPADSTSPVPSSIGAPQAGGEQTPGKLSPPVQASPPASSNAARPRPGERVVWFVDLVAKLVALLTWPLVVVITLAIFHAPLLRIATLLPEKFERSNEITVGSLSLKIQERAKATGSEELASTITGLSQGGLEWLLKIGDAPHRVITNAGARPGTTAGYMLSPSYGVWKELEAKGLLVATTNLTQFEQDFQSLGPQDGHLPSSKLDADQDKKLTANTIQLSESGKRAYRIIIGVVTEMIARKPGGVASEPARK